MPEMNFRVDLNLLLELGEELVSKDGIAVSELVKNSYDADATLVEVSIGEDCIAISDNGIGMSLDTVRNSWLVVGTPFKRRNTHSPKGRRVLGEKGIGRLSAFRLGRDISIRTRAEGEDLVEMSIHIPGRDAINETGVESAPIDSFKVEVSTRQHDFEFPGESRTGTEISVSRLNSEWGDTSIDEMHDMLARLVHPLDTSINDFQIKLYSFGEEIKLEPPEQLRRHPYSIDAEVSEFGKYSAELTFPDENGKPTSMLAEGNFKSNCGGKGQSAYPGLKDGGPGPFRFKLYAWDRDAKDFKGQGKTLDLYSGICLMRDGFLVVQPKSDWLGMNMRRVQNPTMRLSTNQITGAIYIGAEENKNLVDKTDREGIIDNNAFECLKQGVQELVSKLEQARYNYRHSRTLSKGNALSEILDTKPLRDMSKSLPEDAKQQVLEIADEMDRRREELEELLLGRDRMATMGILAAEFVHSARNALSAITDIYPYIESHLQEAPGALQEKIKNMVDAGKILEKLFNELDPYMKFRNRRKTDINITSIVDLLVDLYRSQMRSERIDLVTSIDPNMHFRANQTDMVILMTNFIVNSIYWAPKGANPNGRPMIRIASYESGGNVIIEVEDSGPGVPENYKHSIFELGFSTKEPSGTGIGLRVNSDIVSLYNGKIDLVCKSEMGGAKFTVTLPLKEVF